MANLIPSKLCYTPWQATGKGNKSTQPYSQCIIDAKLSFVLINSLFFKLVIKILKSDKQSPSIHIGIFPNHKQTFRIIRFSFQDAVVHVQPPLSLKQNQEDFVSWEGAAVYRIQALTQKSAHTVQVINQSSHSPSLESLSYSPMLLKVSCSTFALLWIT